MKKYRKWMAVWLAGLMLMLTPLTVCAEPYASDAAEEMPVDESSLTDDATANAADNDSSTENGMPEEADPENAVSEGNEMESEFSDAVQDMQEVQNASEDMNGALALGESLIYSGERTYTRLNGDNRYLTATNIAAKIMEIRGLSKLDGVVLCSGVKYPDALSGSFLAYRSGLPILYQNPTYLNEAPTQFILENVREGGTVYIMGMEIPAVQEDTFTSEGFSVVRLGGADRCETNLRALEETGVPDGCLFVASARNFPDAMCAAACGIPILLVKESLTEAQKTYLAGLGRKLNIYVAGGNAAVSDTVYSQLTPYASSIKRLYGNSRYETAKAIADEIFHPVSHNQVVVTEGNNFVDGLAGSQLAAALGVPMILASDKNKGDAMDYVYDHGILRGFVAASVNLLSNQSAKDIMGLYDVLSGGYKDGTYRLRCAANISYALTVSGNGSNDKQEIRMERCHAQSGQTWTMSTVNGALLMTPLCADKALDIDSGKMTDNTLVQLYHYKNNMNQKWQVSANSDGTYSLQSVKDPSYYLTATTAVNGSSGMSIHTRYTDGRAAYQNFKLEIVDADRNMPDGIFTIACDKDRTKVLEVAGRSKRSEANIQLGDVKDTNAQKFRLSYLGGGYYQIFNVRSGKALDVVGGSSASGTNVQQFDSNTSIAQKWRFETNGSGLRIRSAMGTSLDVSGGSQASGANIWAYRENTTDAQRFCLLPTIPSDEKSYIVAIDAGHQRVQNKDKEPIGPGSTTMKQKVTSGTSGRWSGLDEYVLNLQVALKLQAELENRGYDVYMIRTTHDVNISNAERAQMATAAGADIFIRIHANGSDNSSVRGVLMYQPSMSNPYLSSAVKSGSQRLSSILLSNYAAATGLPNKGILTGDDMTGINWATMPVSIVEMGFMSNQADDLYMASAGGQAAIVQGLANGVDQYFG